MTSRAELGPDAQRSWVSGSASSRANSSTTAVTSSRAELCCRPVVGQEGGVGGVAPGGDPEQALPRRQPGGVDHPPLAVDQGLGHRVHLHRAEPGGVDGRHPGRHVQGPQQGDRQVGEVAADALPTEQRAHGSVGRQAGPGDVGELLVDPADHRLQQVVTAQAGELAGRGRAEAVGLAVPARPQVDDVVDVVDRRRFGHPVDDGPVAQRQRAALGADGVQPGAVRVDDLGRLQPAAVDGDLELLLGDRQPGGRRRR